jgi:hypothetical protein
MIFTWMLAMNLWMNREDQADPFRMAQENVAALLPFPVCIPQMPENEKALVA